MRANMIKFMLFLVSAVSIQQGYSQQMPNPVFPRTIVVNGSAEMEIVPDEIFTIVSLKEFDKKNQGKVGLEQIRKDFLNSCKAIGLPDSALVIASYDGSNGSPWFIKKKKKEELYASINYQVKFSSAKKMDELVARLDDNAVQHFQVIRTSHSNMVQLRRQLKIDAVRAAKEKAAYLAQAINEQADVAVSIEEPAEYHQPFEEQYSNKIQTAMSRDMATEDAAYPEIDFKK